MWFARDGGLYRYISIGLVNSGLTRGAKRNSAQFVKEIVNLLSMCDIASLWFFYYHTARGIKRIKFMVGSSV